MRQFKSRIDNADSLGAEMAIFVNAQGGLILIGMHDDGAITGITPEVSRAANQLISNTASIYVVLLIDNIKADYLLADRAYDMDAIIEKARSSGMEVVISPKKNRKNQRKYDNYLYKLRHLVENTFLYLKQWRGIATRYAKNASSFLAAIQIRCILLWAKISWLHAPGE